MNKYSKRALKTTATVGMSLAMVLSAAAMPVNAATAGKYDLGICKDVDVADKDSAPTAAETKECGTKVYTAIYGQIGTKSIKEFTLDSDVKLANGAGDKVNILAIIEEYESELKAAKTANWADPVTMTITSWIDYVTGVTDFTGSLNAAELPEDGSTLAVIMGKLEAGGVYYSFVKDDANYTAAVADKKIMDTFKKDYGKALGEDSDLAIAFADAHESLKANISDALGETAQSDLKDFVLGFDAVLQNDINSKDTLLTEKIEKNSTKTIADVTLYEGNAEDKLPKVKLNDTKDLKKRITFIKDHEEYDRFKDEDAVVSIIDAYQELIDNVNLDVLKSDAYTDYTKTKVAVNGKSTKQTVQNFVANVTGADENEKAENLANTLNLGQFEILKTAKEDVMDSIWTMETRKVGSYYSDKSDYVTTATKEQRAAFDRVWSENLTTLVDKEEGLFGYDVIAEHMEAYATAYANVTKGIEKLTPTNIKASDKKTLEAAEDAVYELTDGKYKNNATSDEKKAVRAAETKITNLREAFDNLGTTTVAGWYDMGNGNWGYNNEDGTPAAYKWVASGSNWYFVRDGKMARNTWLAANSTDWYYLGSDGKMATSVSVDGCWINSLGIYAK